MKKYLFLLLSLFMLTPIMIVNASSATISVAASKTKVSTGDIITATVTIKSDTPIGYYTYTLDYNPNKLKLLNGSTYVVNNSDKANTKTVTKDFKFKVIGSGSSKITVNSYTITSFGEENKINTTIRPVTISTSSVSSSYSTNNYLSSLEVKGYKLSPSFDKKTNDYTIKIPKSVDKINIIAKAENSKSIISGDGEYEILPDENIIKVKVSSESGNINTYTITVVNNNKEKNSIEIDGKQYYLSETLDLDIDIPYGYKQVKIKINGKEIEALYNSKTDTTIVVLKDENDKSSLFIYDKDNDKYTKYNLISSEKISIVPVDTNKTLKGYKLYNRTINDIEVKCYKPNNNSNYCILYAMNLKTGNEGWYIYDEDEQTIQKFNNDLYLTDEDNKKDPNILIYALAATTFIFGITTIILGIKLNHRKK